MHELAGDFHLQDVWALPAEGGREEFGRVVHVFASGDPEERSSGAAGVLWKIRLKLGAVLGLDGPQTGLDARVATLRERLPDDLRDAPAGPDFGSMPFRSVYLLQDEWAAEIANRTMHGILHVGWVPRAGGGYRGQLAILVKTNGLLGRAYMAAIGPFRHLVVYPAMMRRIERVWRGPADTWWVLYDGDCGLCTWTVAALLAWDRDGRLRPCAIQGADGQRLLSDLGQQERLSAWHLVGPDGARSSGGAAIAPLLRLLPGGTPLAAAASLAPGLSGRAYRGVAEHREGLSRLLPGRAKRRARVAVQRAEAGPRPARRR